MQITCKICGHRDDAERFIPENVGMLPDDVFEGPDWVCPSCLCGVYVPATLTAVDLIAIEVADEAV